MWSFFIVRNKYIICLSLTALGYFWAFHLNKLSTINFSLETTFFLANFQGRNFRLLKTLGSHVVHMSNYLLFLFTPWYTELVIKNNSGNFYRFVINFAVGSANVRILLEMLTVNQYLLVETLACPVCSQVRDKASTFKFCNTFARFALYGCETAFLKFRKTQILKEII